MTQATDKKNFLVAALYHFTPVHEPERLRAPLETLCRENDVKGILLLAKEGINGTIAGPVDGIGHVLDGLRAHPEFAGLKHKESHANAMPFLRLKVRLKKEIVTMGVADIDPLKSVGTYVAPKNWNALIADPDTLVIDTRNDYEVAIGTFEGAVDPKTKTFREFPQWVAEHQDTLNKPRIAMFCTGGIRCEKATAFMKDQGFDEVYHLDGGILKYLEEIPKEDSKWHGDCFVFDQRVSVGHGLEQGPHVLCFGCRMPLAPTDLTRPDYEAGVHCHHCKETRSEAEHNRARERHRQVQLAQARNAVHLGDEA